jgi:hypothetical protein
MSIPMGDPRRDPASRNHYVYRYFAADGRLLYVGCSLRPAIRWLEHKSWRPEMTSQVARWTQQGPYNFDAARAIEKQAIATEEPLYNLTPARFAARRRKSKFTNQRVRELIDSGRDWVEATHMACAEAEEVFGTEFAR